MSRSHDEPSSLTLFRTLRRGAVMGTGTEGEYYRLTAGAGEPHLVRRDLMTSYAGIARRRQSLLHFAYLTDLHVLDPASPGRYEFAQRLHGRHGMEIMLPSYRPQEFLQLHACEAMIRTVNGMGPDEYFGPLSSPITGVPLHVVALTGDLTDNAQGNELQQVRRLLEGGMSQPWPGMRLGVASDSWGDPSYWHPSIDQDEYKRLFGFPAYPDLLEEATHPFSLHGPDLPWLVCCGNHDALILGTALPTPRYQEIVTGDAKARLWPDTLKPSCNRELFIPQPELYLQDPASTVPADPTRASYRTADFVASFLRTRGEPGGHGFTPQNLAAGTAYYVDDRLPAVRIIVLDTVNRSGYHHGSIGLAQMAWLEQRLIEVHSSYRDPGGDIVRSGNPDRLVVLCSHHGLATLTNDRADPEHERDLPRMLRPQVEALLHRFPNVVLWVNGHTHHNAIHPRPDPEGRSTGFWEVTTSSLIDWPCQARMVEIVENGNDTLSIFCTMIDHAAPPDPTEAEGIFRLAGIHRELAANDPHSGVASRRHGSTTDRNVELLLPAPFPQVT